MRPTDLVLPDSVCASLKATTKKHLLQELSDRAATICGLPAREIFDALLHRERLGSTGIGEGIAIPHGKLAKLKGICGVFGRLDRPVDFGSLDGAPVDLVFMILTPESSGADHLKALACAARMLRDPGLVATMRADARRRRALFAHRAALKALRRISFAPLLERRAAFLGAASVRGVSALAAGLRSERMIAREAPLGRIDALAALAPCAGRKIRVLRKTAFLVRNALPALARNRPLLFGIHRRKAATGFLHLLHGPPLMFSQRLQL